MLFQSSERIRPPGANSTNSGMSVIAMSDLLEDRRSGERADVLARVLVFGLPDVAGAPLVVVRVVAPDARREPLCDEPIGLCAPDQVRVAGPLGPLVVEGVIHRVEQILGIGRATERRTGELDARAEEVLLDEDVLEVALVGEAAPALLIRRMLHEPDAKVGVPADEVQVVPTEDSAVDRGVTTPGDIP